ncbi:MAG: hypothetical protein RL545_219 [Actinomycetota bacterium]
MTHLINDIMLILHLIGVGALLSGFFYQMKDMKTGMKVNAGILHGAWLMLVTGFAMLGLIYSDTAREEEPNGWVLSAKSIVITVIFFLAYGNNKKETAPKWVVPVITLLTVTNISLAVLGPIMIAKA